jgi:hypothetical protein
LRYDSAGYEAHVLRFLTTNLRGALPQAQRLSKADEERLILEHLTKKRPLVFVSNQGVLRCCDLGDPNLQFIANHRVIAFGDGYVPWQEDFSYDIAEDGTIRLGRSDSPEVAARVEAVRLQDANIYRYGDALYLVQASEKDPDLSFDPGTLWPFRATNEWPIR